MPKVIEETKVDNTTTVRKLVELNENEEVENVGTNGNSGDEDRQVLHEEDAPAIERGKETEVDDGQADESSEDSA